MSKKSSLSTDQWFLQLNCKIYNDLTVAERNTPIGKRVYAKMKQLNEKILNQ